MERTPFTTSSVAGRILLHKFSGFDVMMSFSSITEVFRVAMIFMINEVVVCSIVRCSVVPVAKWRSPIAVLSFFGILSQLGYSQQTI